MIPFDFLQVRPRSGLGKNDLPCDPRPHSSTDPLEAQGSFRQSDPRRGHLEPGSGEVVEESQPPQAQGDTGQVHKAQNRQGRGTLVVSQTEMFFHIPDRQFDREARPIEFNDLERRKRQICADQQDRVFAPFEHHDPHLARDIAQPHVADHEDDFRQLAVQGETLAVGVSAVNRVANAHCGHSGACGPGARRPGLWVIPSRRLVVASCGGPDSYVLLTVRQWRSTPAAS